MTIKLNCYYICKFEIIYNPNCISDEDSALEDVLEQDFLHSFQSAKGRVLKADSSYQIESKLKKIPEVVLLKRKSCLHNIVYIVQTDVQNDFQNSRYVYKIVIIIMKFNCLWS